MKYRKSVPGSVEALKQGIADRIEISLREHPDLRVRRWGVRDLTRAVAEKVGVALKQDSGASWIKGAQPRDPRVAIALARVLQVDPGWLYFGDASRASRDPGATLAAAIHDLADSRNYSFGNVAANLQLSIPALESWCQEIEFSDDPSVCKGAIHEIAVALNLQDIVVWRAWIRQMGCPEVVRTLFATDDDTQEAPRLPSRPHRKRIGGNGEEQKKGA